MKKADYLARKLETIEVRRRTLAELLGAMGQTGFQGKSLAAAFDVLTRMVREPHNTIFLGYAGSMSTTGQWKIVKWLLENRYVDVLVSTGANVSEDLFEGLGHSYFQGTPIADDAEL